MNQYSCTSWVNMSLHFLGPASQGIDIPLAKRISTHSHVRSSSRPLLHATIQPNVCQQSNLTLPNNPGQCFPTIQPNACQQSNPMLANNPTAQRLPTIPQPDACQQSHSPTLANNPALRFQAIQPNTSQQFSPMLANDPTSSTLASYPLTSSLTCDTADSAPPPSGSPQHHELLRHCLPLHHLRAIRCCSCHSCHQPQGAFAPPAGV